MANPLVGSNSVLPPDLLSALPADRTAADGFSTPPARASSSPAPDSDFSAKLQQFVGGAQASPKPKVEPRHPAAPARVPAEAKPAVDRPAAEGTRRPAKTGQSPAARSFSSHPSKPWSQEARPSGGDSSNAATSKNSPHAKAGGEGVSSEMNQDTETEATEESETTRCASAVAMDSWVPGALEKALASMPVEPPPETPAPGAVHPGGDGNPGQAPGISSLEPAGSQTALVRVDHSADLARPSSPGGQLPPSLLETLRPLPTPTDAAPPSSPSSAPTNSTASPSATAFSLSSFTPVQPQPWLTASGVSASGANESEAPGLALMGMEALSAATASEQSPETVAQPDARDKATEPVSPANGVEAGTSAAGVEGTMRQNSELNSGMDDRAGRHASGETIGSVEMRPLSAAAMAHVRDLRVALQARERGDSAADAIFTNPLEARMSAASTFDTESLVLAPAAAQPAAAVKQEILSRVMEIRSQGSGSMNVVLRPDPNTQLSVQLRSHAGGVQVMVTMERGDATHLRGAWDSLQQSLAQQGVQLSNLEVNRAAIGESLLRAAPAAGPSLDRLAAQGSSQNAFAGSDAEANSGRHGRMADWAYQDNPGASPWMDRRSGGSSNSDLSETTSSSLATRASRRESRNDAAESASVAPQAIDHLETWA